MRGEKFCISLMVSPMFPVESMEMVSRYPVLELFHIFCDAITKIVGVSRIMLWLQDLLLKV